MSASKEETLSPDELRKKLYQTFKNRGLLDTLKTQLRNQLIQELQSPLVREQDARSALVQPESISVLASNSLVIDHLQNSGYEYTLSVFYPECGMSKDKVFSKRDLLQLLKISPHSPVYKSLVSNVMKGQKGLLINLLTELINHHNHPELCDADTQTSTTQDYRASLVEKLQMIDEEYETLREKGNRWASVEAKLAEYRKEMQEQAEAELKAKLHHFQEVEVARVRMEEQEKSRQEIQELRHRLEKTYELKSEALISREKNAIERLQKQQEIEEKEIYAQRQALLKEIESVRNRETELRYKMESFEKSCKLHEEKVKSTEELLRRRELAVKTFEDTYDQKLNNELQKHQLELKEDYARRTEKLTENEIRNKEETVRLQKEAAILDTKVEEHGRTVSELKRVQVECESVRAQVNTLIQQNTLLRERLEGMSDYAAVRQERLELQAEVRLLKEQLQESQQERQKLHRELSGPSHEQLALQAEIRRLEMARRLDQEEFQSQKEAFHTQLTQEVERCSQLKAQLLECEERTKWMSANTEEIKQQLRLTQQALENEVLRNPKPSLVDRSVLDLNLDKVVSPDLYVARAGYDEDVCDPGPTNRVRQQHRPRSGSPNLGTELVNEALSRIRELEKEAETLEEAYRSYKQRAVRGQVSCMPPERIRPPPHPTSTFTRPMTAAQQRVTFAVDKPIMHSVYMDRELNRSPSAAGKSPPRVHSPPPRRLSSTPVSATKSRQRIHSEQDSERCVETSGVDRSAVTFAGLSLEREVSPIPASATVPASVTLSSEENTDITPPSSPQMKSTTRDHFSPPKLQDVISSSSQESSPKPEKISIQDLTEPLPEDLHSNLEPFQDTHRISFPEIKTLTQPQDSYKEEESFPQTHKGEDNEAPSSIVAVGESEEERRQRESEEERRQRESEEERRKREREEERRQREMEEAQERERSELERLKQELLEQEAVYERGGVEAERDDNEGAVEKKEAVDESDVSKASSTQDKEKSAVGHVEPDTNDPLHKYMMMVMQGRETQKEQNSGKEEPENQSADAVVLSDNKDDSIAAFSHDDADEDFW